MKRVLMAIVAALAGMTGCLDIPRPIEPNEPSHALALRGDWTPAERDELAGACRDWEAWTSGRLACHLAGAGETPEATIVRGATDPSGYADLDPWAREITIDAARMWADGWELTDIRAMGAHMMGRAAAIPRHDSPGILSRVDIVGPFSPEDREACRSRGFCD